MKNKGQAAMEFLMTYGWAILVVIAAIAALAYFGVLDPSRLLPEKCEFPSGLDCVDKASISQTGHTVTLALKNNIGFPIEITGIALGTAGTSCPAIVQANTKINGVTTDLSTATSYYSTRVLNNGNVNIEIDCTTIQTGKFNQDFIITYNNTETGLTHPAAGTVRGKA